MQDYERSQTVNGRFVCAGSMFKDGRADGSKNPQKVKQVDLPEGPRTYLAYISLTMLSAVGGEFDEDDTVYADIYRIDGKDIGPYYINPAGGLQEVGGPLIPRERFEFGYDPDWLKDELVAHDVLGRKAGGVWGEDFGELPYKDPGKNYKTMRISSWVGPVGTSITFRLFVDGDDWVGASYYVLEL